MEDMRTGLRSWDPRAEYGLPDRLGAFIDGNWVVDDDDQTLEVEDPGTGRTIAATVDASEATVGRAVRSADVAFRSAWSTAHPAQRGRVLTAIAAALRSDSERLARTESLDTGKPLSQARGDVETAARYFEFYAGVTDKILGETLPQPSGTLAYTVREPLGVIAHITPWNSPLNQMSRGVAPSLAAGNTVVVKPSELTPLTSLIAARLFLDAGLPAGACNIVPGIGPGAGATLVEHPLVQHVSFTGSVETGRAVAHMAAERIITCGLELGGKSPTIVLADADLDAAAAAGAAAVVRNSGQSCFATTRLVVDRRCHDEFVAKVVERVSGLTVGHGLDDPDLGPLASARQLERVRTYLAGALEQGAKVANGEPQGPDASDGVGHFMTPTILVDVTNDMRVAREEVFGPVQSVLVFDDEEEAVEIANNSMYGLAAGVFTQNLSAAHRLAAVLQAGQVQINGYPAGGVDTPFGGYKSSGIGREKGVEALRHYTQVKTVIVQLMSSGAR